MHCAPGESALLGYDDDASGVAQEEVLCGLVGNKRKKCRSREKYRSDRQETIIKVFQLNTVVYREMLAKLRVQNIVVHELCIFNPMLHTLVSLFMHSHKSLYYVCVYNLFSHFRTKSINGSINRT